MMVTEQPWRASTRAVPLPQPLLPPTQSATLPVRALAVLAVCTSVNVGIDRVRRRAVLAAPNGGKQKSAS